MPNLYEKVLQKTGLDNNETKIYLAALSLKQAPVSAIAKKANITRSTCYGVLDNLVQKGLITKTESAKGIINFVTENPELINVYLESQRANFEQLIADVRNIMPDLRNLMGEFSFKPQIEYFEGKKGIIAALEAIMPDIKKMAKVKIPLLIHGAPQKIMEIWPQFPQYVQKRAKTGVESRILIWEDFPPEFKEIEKIYKVKRIPKKYAYPTGTNILEDKVLLFDFDNFFAVIIKNKNLTQMIRIFFEFMWDHL